ncbi:MAG: ribosome-associated translation inhibitor RaiA [Ignavibacteriales bacterium]|nr:ribosome-associated translation inhibitor RaiA [Ignavibacteriales bacterium]
MDIHITARHFKAHESLRTYAFDSLKKLERYYNGIVSANVVLSYEKAVNSVKRAELYVTVYGTILKAIVGTDDFVKSIDSVIAKVERQIQKYKSKQRAKKKSVIRKTQAKP